MAENLQLPEARNSFSRGGVHATNAERYLNTPLVSLARKLPFVKDDVMMVQALAKGARRSGPIALDILDTVDKLRRTAEGPDGLELSEGGLDFATWPDAATKLSRAATSVRDNLAEIQDLAGGNLTGPVRKARDAFADQGGRAASTLDSAASAVELIPYFFGADRPRTWFLFIQNPAELRGTGGFLGAFAILRADSGKLSFEQLDSNDGLPRITDPPYADPDFADHYDQFATRTFWPNSNFSPDFPSTGRLMAQMWKQGTGQELDGVIAIDATGLNYLLGLVGPVDMPPFGEVNQGNFLRFALNEAYIQFERRDRARFLLEVALRAWNHLLGADLSSLASQAEVMSQMVSTKRIQIWSPEKQALLTKLGIAGELHPKDDADFLMVVGNNAGGNKLDYYTRRRTQYLVDIDRGGKVLADIGVDFKNTAPSSGLPADVLGLFDEFPSGLLRSYTSVFMPADVIVQGVEINGEVAGEVDNHNEKGLRAVSSYVPVPSKSTTNFSVLTQRQLTRPGEYRLIVQQQPTLHPDEFDLQIMLPQGSSLVKATKGMKIEGNRVTWKGYLTREREFLVRYETPKRSGL